MATRSVTPAALVQDPYAALGVAVLTQALHDSRRQDALGAEARIFLASEDVTTWAELLGLDGAVVRHRLRAQGSFL